VRALRWQWRGSPPPLDKATRADSVRASFARRPRWYKGRRSIFREQFQDLGGSSNGRTADSGSAYQGSNPCPPAQAHARRKGTRSACVTRPHRLAVRTPASHVGNTGSIPVGVTHCPWCETKARPTVICRFCTRPAARDVRGRRGDAAGRGQKRAILRRGGGPTARPGRAEPPPYQEERLRAHWANGLSKGGTWPVNLLRQSP
jgi:hypothetical protein